MPKSYQKFKWDGNRALKEPDEFGKSSPSKRQKKKKKRLKGPLWEWRFWRQKIVTGESTPKFEQEMINEMGKRPYESCNYGENGDWYCKGMLSKWRLEWGTALLQMAGRREELALQGVGASLTIYINNHFHLLNAVNGARLLWSLVSKNLSHTCCRSFERLKIL